MPIDLHKTWSMQIIVPALWHLLVILTPKLEKLHTKAKKKWIAHLFDAKT
jgi:hypothetical protein